MSRTEKTKSASLLLHLQSAVAEVESASAGSSTAQPLGLDRKDEWVRNLLRCLDAILSHGLREPGGVHWPLNRELLTKAERVEISSVWKPLSARAHSIAWLCWALNEGVLEFHFLALGGQAELRRRYYRDGALMLNSTALPQITDLLAPLSALRFQLKPSAPTSKSKSKVNKDSNSNGHPPIASLAANASVDAESELEASVLESDSFSLSGDDSGTWKVPEEAAEAASVDVQMPKRLLQKPGRKASKLKAPRPRPSSTSSGGRTPDPEELHNRSIPMPPQDDMLKIILTPRQPLHILQACESESALLEHSPAQLHPVATAPSSSLFLHGQASDSDEKRMPTLPIEQPLKSSTPTGTPLPQSPQKPREIPLGSSLPSHLSNGIAHPDAHSEESLRDILAERMKQISSRASNASERSWEHSDFLLQSIDEKEEKEKKETKSVEGDIRLDSGEVIKLALDVFVAQGEELQSLFRVFGNFPQGSPEAIFLLLTSYGIYLLRRIDGEVLSAETHRRFESLFVRPLRALDYVEGLGEGQGIRLNWRREWKTPNTSLYTASAELGAKIAAAFRSVKRLGEGSTFDVSTEGTEQKVILRKWAAANIPNERQSNKHVFSLVFHRSSEAEEGSSIADGALDRAEYLQASMEDRSSWLRRRSPWAQSFLLLKGPKLYHFADSTCKEGLGVYHLKSEKVGVRTLEEEEAPEHPHGLELDTPQALLWLSAPTREQRDAWLSALIAAISSPEEVESGVAAVALADEAGLHLGQLSGPTFVRSLLALPYAHISSSRYFDGKDQSSLVLEARDKSGEKQLHWLHFRTSKEAWRFIHGFKGFSDLDVSEMKDGEMPSGGLDASWSTIPQTALEKS